MTLHERVVFVRDLLTAILLFLLLVGMFFAVATVIKSGQPKLSATDQELCLKTGAPIYCDAVKR